jgi:prephenate dehydrogenase
MKLAIIGGGQIGASIARAAAASGEYSSIVVSEIDETSRKALQQIVRDDGQSRAIEVTGDSKSAVKRADVVVLATPIDQFGPVVEEIKGSLKSGVAITDVGSIKQQSANAITGALPKGMKGRYVPAHPTVGSDGSGPATSKPDMFERAAIIVDTSTADRSASSRIRHLWQDVGGRPIGLTASNHDKLYGTTSHLQHLVAFAATGSLPAQGGALEESQRPLFQMTRIANANPSMWLPVFAGNSEAIMASGGLYMDELSGLKKALQKGDKAALTAKLAEGKSFAAGYQAPETDDVQRTAAEVFALKPDAAAATGVGLPLVLAHATARNAHRVEAEIDKPLSLLANRSLKEATRLTQTDPEAAAAFLLRNREAVLREISGFELRFANGMASVIQGDQPAQKAMIEAAAERRNAVSLEPRPHLEVVATAEPAPAPNRLQKLRRLIGS